MPQKAAYQVSERTRHQKIFLHKAKFLPGCGGVVGIQHSRQRFRFESSSECAHEIAGAKLLKIEEIGSRRGPEAEGVDRLPSVAYNRTIERYSEQARRA